jgi:hypothetical protein
MMHRNKIFGYFNNKYKLIEILPDDRKETLKCNGLIYQKYYSKFDRFLSFIFGISVFHLVWEYPNGKRYYEYKTEKNEKGI